MVAYHGNRGRRKGEDVVNSADPDREDGEKIEQKKCIIEIISVCHSIPRFILSRGPFPPSPPSSIPSTNTQPTDHCHSKLYFCFPHSLPMDHDHPSAAAPDSPLSPKVDLPPTPTPTTTTTTAPNSTATAKISKEDRQTKGRNRHAPFQTEALNQVFARTDHPTLQERTDLAKRLSMYVSSLLSSSSPSPSSLFASY
jgi:hypothetical protein